jgi:hypothetical protein
MVMLEVLLANPQDALDQLRGYPRKPVANIQAQHGIAEVFGWGTPEWEVVIMLPIRWDQRQLTLLGGAGVAPADPDAAAVIAAMEPVPDAARQQVINDYVVALKAAGVWSKLDRLFVFAAHSAQAGLLDWIHPDTSTPAELIAGMPFEIDRGVGPGNVTTQYVNTHFVTATDGVNYKLDDASFGAYSRTAAPHDGIDIGARVAGSNPISLVHHLTASHQTTSGRINQSGPALIHAYINALGMAVIRRTPSDTISLFRDGHILLTETLASTNLNHPAFFVGAFNDNGTATQFTNHQYPIAFFGAAMSEAEQLALFNITENYLLAVGATVEDTPPSMGNAVWSWFNNPRAIHADGTTFIGSLTSAGSVDVHAYNHATEATTSARVIKMLHSNDHATPQLLSRASDGRIMLWATRHNGSNIFQRVSTNPGDISEWNDFTVIPVSQGLITYPNPIQLTGETDDPIYLFYRAFTPAIGIYYTKSTNGGVDWTSGTRIFENGAQRPYFHIVANGNDRVDFVVTDGHPSEVATNSIYHCYYEAGNLRKTDGTLIGAIDAGPYTPSPDLTLVYDGTTNRAWNWDIAIDGSGHPVIVFAAFTTTTDHRYRYARWNGTAWGDWEITTAGSWLYSAEPYYSGGVHIDPHDVNTVYASRDPGDNTHQLWKFTTSDNGETWSGSQFAATPEKAFRPYVVAGAVDNKRLLYVTGRYTTYVNYDTEIVLAET